MLGSEDGVNHLVHLRLAWANGRFETLCGLALSLHPYIRPSICLNCPVLYLEIYTDLSNPFHFIICDKDQVIFQSIPRLSFWPKSSVMPSCAATKRTRLSD